MTSLDLAVVGGGIAGSFVAYRMSRLWPDWSIGLFEASWRIGGRLVSVTPPGINGIKAELGGMRYRTSQPHVSALIDELGLETRPFRTVHEDNAYLLRGVRLTVEDFRDPARVPYTVNRTFRGKTPGEILFEALDAVVPGAAELSPDEWVACKRMAAYRGRPLYECALSDVLRDVVGNDGYTLITDSFGYESVFGNRNAADGIPWLLIESRPESENMTLVDGMERLPRELAARFARNGGSVQFNRRLMSVRHEPKGFTLGFTGDEVVAAQRVVLAMPRAALERTDCVDLMLPGIGAVTSHAAVKLCLAYESAWWRELGVNGLRTTADSPLQKIYWFDRAVATAEAGPALALSYTDGKAAELWRTLAGRPVLPADRLPFDASDRWQTYSAPTTVVSRAHTEMARLHGGSDIPRPHAAAYMDWGLELEAGAYSLWNIGVRSWEVIPMMIQPSPDAALYVCGESYSASQGWVEGALETAHMVVDRLP